MPTGEAERNKPDKRRVMILDDHPLVRRGLTELIDSEPDLHVCAAVAADATGIAAVETCQPDIVITDLSLRPGDRYWPVSNIHSHHKDLPILVLSMNDSQHFAEGALSAGASALVGKQAMGETLLAAIHRLLDD